MSDDLISRKETEKILRAYADDVGCNRGQYDLANGILKAVCHMNKPDIGPTVYDVDKVIERLKELKTYKLNMADAMSEIMRRGELGNYVCLEDVFEIVKSGGVVDE